jgi:hypothetical protein
MSRATTRARSQAQAQRRGSITWHQASADNFAVRTTLIQDFFARADLAYQPQTKLSPKTLNDTAHLQSSKTLARFIHHLSQTFPFKRALARYEGKIGQALASPLSVKDILKIARNSKATGLNSRDCIRLNDLAALCQSIQYKWRKKIAPAIACGDENLLLPFFEELRQYGVTAPGDITCHTWSGQAGRLSAEQAASPIMDRSYAMDAAPLTDLMTRFLEDDRVHEHYSIRNWGILSAVFISGAKPSSHVSLHVPESKNGEKVLTYGSFMDAIEIPIAKQLGCSVDPIATVKVDGRPHNPMSPPAKPTSWRYDDPSTHLRRSASIKTLVQFSHHAKAHLETKTSSNHLTHSASAPALKRQESPRKKYASTTSFRSQPRPSSRQSSGKASPGTYAKIKLFTLPEVRQSRPATASSALAQHLPRIEHSRRQ